MADSKTVKVTVIPNNVASAVPVGGSLLQKAYSPTVDLTETEEGVQLSITDVDGEHSALIPKGDQGEPGVSPIIQDDNWYIWDPATQQYVDSGVPAQKPFVFDNKPTADSDNLLTSGTVKAALNTKLDSADVPTKVSDLQNDAGYLTEHQDISGKADKSEIPTKVSDLDNDAGYLTTHQDISGKADKTEIPTKVSQLENDSGYVNDISMKADKTELPTKVSDLDNDAGYLTTHQDITGKADKTEIPTKVSQLENDSGYLTQHQDISGKADTEDIPTKLSELENDTGYLTQHQDVSGKADITDIPTKVSQLENDSGYITDISGKADVSDIPTKVSELENDAGYLTQHQDISNKADASAIPTKVSQLENDSGYLTTHQDISSKADKSEIPTKVSDLTNDAGYLVASDIAGKADASDIPTKVSDLQNDAGYLTSHQDISGKADKSEIPTKVSDLQNDAGYLTQHQDISGKANVADIPTKVSQLQNDSGYLTSHQDISGKIDEPATAGTNGQVLTSDGNGGASWEDPTGGNSIVVQDTEPTDENTMVWINETAGSTVQVPTYQEMTAALADKADVEDIPTKMSDLTNDSGYLTEHQDISGKADAITATKSGAIVSIDDAMAAPVDELVVHIKPIQSGSGDPSPSNLRSINGWTGCTVFNGGKNYVGNVSSFSNMQNIDGIWENTVTDSKQFFQAVVQLFNGSTYIKTVGDKAINQIGYNEIAINIDVANCTRIVFKHSGSQRDAGLLFDFNGEQGNYKLCFNTASINPNELAGLKITSLTMFTESPNDNSITWQTETGTVYGGTLNVTTGVLTVDKACVTFTGAQDEAWSIYGPGEAHQCFQTALDAKQIGWQTSICNRFKNINGAYSSSEFGIYCDHYSVRYIYFRQPNSSIVTLEDWKSWLADNPVEVVYNLETPQTIVLDPLSISTVTGANTVWSDANGAISLTYKVNTKQYVDDKVADVRINGESITSNGIANIPFSSSDNAGCIKTASWAGNAVNNDGCLYTVRAEESVIKAGTDYYRPIVPNTQQVSVFYGLAKAAGADMASSSNAVGTYTDNAKAAIQSMIGTDKVIAPVETDLGYASQAYAIGDVFMCSGKLCVATDAIAANAVIQIGTNCEETSVAAKFVKKTDYATNNTAGVVKIEGDGIGIRANGKIYTVPASDDMIKSASANYNQIVPAKQHISTFYGLATAAGDSTQSYSNNAVGTYTDSAKSAIQTMLGVDEELNDKADAIAVTKSGNTVSIDNAVAAPVDNLVINFAPIQSGTGNASPSNVRPISGIAGLSIRRTGKNMYDGAFSGISSEVTYHPIYVGSEIVTVSTTTPQSAEGYSNIFAIAGSVSSGASSGYNDVHSTRSRTITPIDGYITIAYRNAFDIDPRDYGLQIEVGSTATSYEPYAGQTYNVDWTNDAGTVYGGTLDVVTGVLTVNWIKLDINNETYLEYNSHTSSTLIVAAGGVPHGVSNTAISNRFSVNIGSGVGRMVQINSKIWFVLPLSEGSEPTVDTAKQWFSDNETMVVYELSTPETYQLDPVTISTLAGTNNIWSNTNGTTSVTYKADTKQYVDEKVSDVQVNGTSIVNNGVANIPYVTTSAPGLVMVNGYGLYPNTQNGHVYVVKATDEQIKEGTNNYFPVVSSNTANAAFYGLAKAAGDTTQAASSNAVGTYTDSAKTAIKTMLGLSTADLAAAVSQGFVEQISGTTVTITGEPNVRYVCGEVYSISITPPASGSIDVIFTSGSTVAELTLPATVKMPEWWTGVESGYTYELCITDGVYGSVMAWAV